MRRRPVAERLRSLLEGETVLLIPVSLDIALRQAMLLPGHSRRTTVPPHVTLIYPFVRPGRIDAALLQRLQGLFAGHAAFSYQLTGVASFADVQYLVPEPAACFVALVDALVRVWPDHPPYRGEFEQSVPHVTIAPATKPHDPARLQALLPSTLQASAVELWAKRPLRPWQRVGRFSLASADDDDGGADQLEHRRGAALVHQPEVR